MILYDSVFASSTIMLVYVAIAPMWDGGETVIGSVGSCSIFALFCQFSLGSGGMFVLAFWIMWKVYNCFFHCLCCVMGRKQHWFCVI